MTSQIEHEASNLQGGQRNASRNDGHLPECHFIDISYGRTLEGICICHALRACQQRVRMEDDDYAYVAAQAEADGRRRGWSEALDAAIGVVVTWQADRALPPFTALLAALNALRDQPADQTGYKPPDAP